MSEANYKKVTQEQVRRTLDYDPVTGLFTRKINAGGYHAGKAAGSKMRNGYMEIAACGFRFLQHRLAWFYVHGTWPLSQLDHINGNPADNRIENLREATNAQNQANQGLRKSNKSGFKGVSYDRLTGKWRVDISVNGRSRYVGSYSDIAVAAQSAVDARNINHGQFVNHGTA